MELWRLLVILVQFGLFIGYLLFILLVLFFTCYRPRKVEVQDYTCCLKIWFINQELDANPPNTKVLSLSQCNPYIIQPPDYACVLKMEEEGLPDYQQAVEEGSETGVGNAFKLR